MPDTDDNAIRTALQWIVDVLERRAIPYQLVGGLAARAYGATRPIADIDLYIPATAVGAVLDAGADCVTRPPAAHKDAHWDLAFMQLVYAGRKIEVGIADDAKYRDARTGAWRDAAIDFESADVREVFGVRVPVMPRDQLVAYKRALGRDVDLADVEAIAGA